MYQVHYDQKWLWNNAVLVSNTSCHSILDMNKLESIGSLIIFYQYFCYLQLFSSSRISMVLYISKIGIVYIFMLFLYIFFIFLFFSKHSVSPTSRIISKNWGTYTLLFWEILEGGGHFMVGEGYKHFYRTSQLKKNKKMFLPAVQWLLKRNKMSKKKMNHLVMQMK